MTAFVCGIDFKAAHKRARMVFDNVPVETPIRVLGNTFGNAKPFVEELVKRGYLDIIYDSVWRTDHAHGTAEYSLAMMDLEWLNGLKKTPEQQLYFCPYLEWSRIKSGVPVNHFKDFVKIADDCIYIVNNPLREGRWLNMEGVINCRHHENYPTGGDINGYHGFHIHSEDGADTKNADLQKKQNQARKRGAGIFLDWVCEDNFKTDKQNLPRNHPEYEQAPEPKDRDPRNMTADLLKAQVFRCERRGRHKGQGVWKAYAEHKNTPPTSRELKPAYLSGEYYDEVYITNIEGKAKNTLTYAGKEHGVGRHVWRYGKYGYEKALSNLRQTGKPTSILWGRRGARKYKLATLNSAYRLNDYK